MRSLAVFAIFTALSLSAQNAPAPQTDHPSGAAPLSSAQPITDQPPAQPANDGRHVTVPAGTEVLLQLKSAIDSRNNHVGDGVYCQTSFPVTVGNVIAIPAGTYVKGEIVKLQRAGRVKGRGEVLFKFNSMIFPNGYTVDMPGSVHNDSGTSAASVDKEGKIKADGSVGKDVETVAKGGAYGLGGGTIATGTLNGARIGGGIGLAAGLATVLLTRGNEVRIEPGASFRMVTQLPLTVDIVGVDPNRMATETVPRPTVNNRLPQPAASSNPK
jgi:type IV secretion system protein VirB10